MRFVIFDIYS